MKVVLELQDQPSNVRRITVRHDIVIGRGSDCNLRLSAPQVSRRHCFLRVGRDSVSVTDLDSSNGTFIDGTRITAGKRYDIANGAQLALGPIRFIIHVRSDVAVPETANSGSKPESKRSRSGRDAVAGLTADDSNTVSAKLRAEDGEPPMNYTVEQAGASAEPHEPTADYLDEQISTNGSANLFSNASDPADSRVGIADFNKRHAEQLESNEETNDFPDAEMVGRSAIAHEEPKWDSSIANSSGSAENPATSNAADDVESAWLSVDDDTILPEPMNLGNAYVGEASHDAFNDADAALVDAGVIEDVEEIEEVMEVHDFDEVSEVAEAVEVIDVETNPEEIEEVVEVQDSIEIEDAAQAEQTVNDAEAMDVQDWLNFDQVVEVQETADVEEVVEDALDEAVIGKTEDVRNVEDPSPHQAINAIEEVAVIEEASANAEDMQVEDWLNFDDVAEVQESLDVEDVVEDAADEVSVSEIQDASFVAYAAEPQSDDRIEEVAVIEEASANAEDMQVQDWLNFDEVAEVQEPLEVEEFAEVEQGLNEAVVHETGNALNVEEAIEIEPEANMAELAEFEYFSDDEAIIEVDDGEEVEDIEEIQESLEVHAATSEPPAAEDAREIAFEDEGESNWFRSDEVSDSDAFFDNFAIPELESDDEKSAEAAAEDNDIDPDLQNFLKGF